MKIEFDEAKDALNLAIHGYSLRVGAVVLEHAVGAREDNRRSYGETRINAFGLVEGRLFACTYTMRGEVVRVISVRKANLREQREWQS